MSTGLAQRYADFLMRYSRPVLVVLLLATVLIGSGAGNIDSGLTIASFGSDSTEAKKLDYVQKNFSNDRENTTAMQVIIRGDNVLSKKSLLDTLRFQRALRENETVNSTLVETQPTVGISNQIAIAAIQQRFQSRNNSVRNTNGDESTGTANSGPQAGQSRRLPTLDEQITQLESMSPAEVTSITKIILDPKRAHSGPVDPYSLLSTDYEAGAL